MGQYWKPINLDKREYVDPHKLGCGLKLWEQLAGHPGVGAALIVLTAAQREPRGGGDLDMDENWHGPERKFPEHSGTPGPMPESYSDIAKSVIGRWAGDRIVIVGDYAEDSDLPAEFEASKLFGKCRGEDVNVRNDDPVGAAYRIADGGLDHGKYVHFEEVKPPEFLDVTYMVAAVIEHELGGKFVGTGWREWKENERA